MLMTCQEVADACRVSQGTIRRWVRSGRIAAIKLTGRTLRFRRGDVMRLLGEPNAE